MRGRTVAGERREGGTGRTGRNDDLTGSPDLRTEPTRDGLGLPGSTRRLWRRRWRQRRRRRQVVGRRRRGGDVEAAQPGRFRGGRVRLAALRLLYRGQCGLRSRNLFSRVGRLLFWFLGPRIGKSAGGCQGPLLYTIGCGSLKADECIQGRLVFAL